MIFAQLGPQYLDEPHRDVLTRMEAAYQESVTIMQAFWSEADIDTRFWIGDQTLWNDLYYGGLPVNRRRHFTFNRIRPIINMITGHQRRNRKSTIVVPIENGDSKTADQFTKVLTWVKNQDGVLETISDAFLGSCITGMNLLQVWLDFRTDPISGNIRVDNCPYNTFIIDPFFKKPDLSDCNYIWKRNWLTKREAISLLPGSEEVIMGMTGQDNNRDGKFQFTPESYNYSMKNLLTYDEYYYKDFRTQETLVDTKTGESTEWRGNSEDLKLFLTAYPHVQVIRQDVPTTRLAIVVQGRVLFDGPNPLGIDSFPFIPVFAYYTSETPYYAWRWQGVVRSLRDSQYLYNRRIAIQLDILESQINSGWKFKENALVNPKDVYLAGQGRGLALKEEAQMTDVEKIQPPQIPPSMFEMSKVLANEMTAVSGVNEELLGAAVDDKAGILSMLRQGAGLTTLQILFDRLDQAQKILGKVMIDVIQTNFVPGKIQNILQEKPEPQFYSKAFGKYDTAIEEGFNTTTQKQMQFAQLLQLRQAGVPIPDDLLVESATLQNKEQLIQSLIQSKQQQQQATQAQTQVAMDQQKAQTDLAHARAVADRGLGIERVSRVQENQALAEERRAEAAKDRELGLLNIVKALKEIDDIDLQQLEKLFNLSDIVRNRETSSTEVTHPLTPEQVTTPQSLNAQGGL